MLSETNASLALVNLTTSREGDCAGICPIEDPQWCENFELGLR